MNFLNQCRPLPGTQQEQVWLQERLETLSVKESIVLKAIFQKALPKNKAEAVNALLSMYRYDVCFPAANYKQLGRFYLRHECSIPEDALWYADLDKMGHFYEEKAPGVFMGNCYVIDPRGPNAPEYDGNGALIPEDNDWCVKVKLSSPACPEGVWLRLPDWSGSTGQPDEVALLLDELKVRSLDSCTLLEAKCILPDLDSLMEQYDDIVDLVNDGNDLGYVLAEQGMGALHFMERFTAALEYENCRSLQFALDISQNLDCYEWKSCSELPALARQTLKRSGVPDEVLDSGAINLKGYGEDLLESAGYRLTRNRSGYIARNNREFRYERSLPQEGQTQMMQ